MSRLAALVLAAALALGLVGCDTSSIVPGGSGDVMPNPAASQTGTTPSDGQDAAFQMHFIDVGQALSVLVECDGQFMLYDGGNVDDGSLIVSYLQSQGVEQLEYEHEMISHLLAAMQEYSLSILRTKQVDRKWLKNCLDYLQDYADVFHHQKEEELVFSRLKQASPQGKILVEQGMVVEHDLARYYIRSMKKLLKKDVTEKVCVRLIGFIQAYIDLLECHIEKENSVAYPYAVRKLAMDEIQKAFDAHGQYERMEELREFLKLS